jgi:hypothetical protein
VEQAKNRDEEGAVAPAAEPDYRFLLEVLMKTREDERDSLERLESKVAVVLAGTVAVLGFSFEKSATQMETFTSALFLAPLVVLLWALLPLRYGQAPSAKEFCKTFPTYPSQALKTACEAIAKLQDTNAPNLRKKASRLRWGTLLLIAVAIIVVGVRCADTFQMSKGENHAGPTTRNSSSASSASAAAANARFNDHLRREGRQEVGRKVGQR